MKKSEQIELDVDFIGGQNSMTKDEEKAISEYIKAQKMSGPKKQFLSKNKSQRSKVSV